MDLSGLAVADSEPAVPPEPSLVCLAQGYMDFWDYAAPAIAFGVGVLFAPVAWGLLFLLFFIILFEWFLYIVQPNSYNWTTRLLAFVFGLVGFFAARLLIGDRHPWRLWYKENHRVFH